MSNDALQFKYDAQQDILEVENVKYSGEVFRQFGGMLPLHSAFKLAGRENGVITICRMDATQRQALHGATDELVKGSAGIVTKESNPPGKFESRHKIGDLVTITARVAGIQFTDSKVRYAFDLSEQLAMVDSEHVEPAQPVGKD